MMRAILFTLDETDSDCLAKVPCPECKSYLSVHLPDPHLPERLLGTCSTCKSWFLMDVDTNRMIKLDEDGLRPE